MGIPPSADSPPRPCSAGQIAVSAGRRLLMKVRGYFEFLVSGAFLTVGELVTEETAF